MTTFVGGGQISNAYSDGVSGGFIPGDAATGWYLRYIGDLVDAYEPTKTPVYSSIKKRETVNQLKVEWGLKRVRPHKVTLSAALTTGTTSLTVGTTDIKKLQKYMVLRIMDATAGDEIVWLSADPNLGAGTVTIVRAQGGTSDPGVDHAISLTAEVIGTAEPLTGVDHAISPYLYGDLTYNNIQRFAGGPKMDRVARFTPDLERKGDKLAGILREEGLNQRILLEKALLLGGRQAGAPATPTASLMGGIRYYLGSIDSNNNVRTVTGSLSIYDIETIMAAVWARYTDNVATTAMVSMNTMLIINRAINGMRMVTGDTNSVDLRLRKIMFGTGEVSFMVHPWMPEGEIWGVDFGGMTLCEYAGEGNGGWHTEINAHSGSYDWQSVVGVYSFKMEGEPTMWRITGFDRTLANYSTAGL